MCGGERASCKAFVLANLEQLKGMLLDSLTSAASPAKRVRAMKKHGVITFVLRMCNGVICGAFLTFFSLDSSV